MRRLALLLLLSLLPAVSATHAGGLRAGEREAILRLGFKDLDRDTSAGFDLGTRDGLQLQASLGWMRSPVFELGVTLTLAKLEGALPALGQSQDLDGLSFGGFLHAHYPTGRTAVPFFGLGANVFGGDLGDLYQWETELMLGVKAYPSDRLGFTFAVTYGLLNGEGLDDLSSFALTDLAPDGTAVGVHTGLLLKF